LGALCHEGKLNFLESVSKEDSFDIMTIFNEKKYLDFLGIGLKFGGVFRIGFLAHFHNISELNIKNCFTDAEMPKMF
jgi:hypothetical protein